MKLCGIYGIRSISDGIWYIGQSVDMLYRRRKHFEMLSSKRHPNPHLQRAFDKFGIENFDFLILEEIPIDRLDVREFFWISVFDSRSDHSGYNMAGGGNFNRCHSVESRAKIAAKAFGRKVSEETRRKLSIAGMGRKHTAESKAKIKAGQVNRTIRPTSLETRLKLSRAGIGQKRPKSQEHRDKISMAKMGISPSPETRLKQSHAMKARISMPHLRYKWGKWLIGRKLSPEQIAKIVAFHTGRKRSELTRLRIKQSKLAGFAKRRLLSSMTQNT